MSDETAEPSDAGDDEVHAPAELVELHEILAFAEAVENGPGA